MNTTVEDGDRERYALLVSAGEIFHRSLDLTETLDNVARLAVERFCDICLFDLIDERSDRLFVTAFAHRDRSMERALASAGVSELLYVEEFGVHPVVQVSRTGEPFFIPHMDEATLVQHAASRQHEQYMRRFGYRSKIVVPVVAQGEIFGALTFVRTGERFEFTDNDLPFAIELGRRAGLAVANAKQFRREQYVAETLQRAFLPTRFPQLRNAEISAHYSPGSTEADIGGDWYDAFENEEGEIVVTIGDVTGRGVEAARVMVLLRQAVRIAALTARDPAKILDVCNRALLSEGAERFASVFIGIITPSTREVRYASAGQTPPLLRLVDGTVRMFRRPSAPLGISYATKFDVHAESCPAGSILVLYTDGAIEMTHDVVAGERLLAATIATRATLHVPNPAEFIARTVLSKHLRDDIAILTVAFRSPSACWQVDIADARSAFTLREQFFENLTAMCLVNSEELSACGLIFGEVIANAVRHAPGPLTISLEQRGDSMMLHAIDGGPGFEYHPTLPSNLWSEGGRGLYLISQIARRVHVERLPAKGSHVTVALPVRCEVRARSA
ncbi:MAG TPA: SpoIIE family protein phosphatase [Candidatus Acidoferrales bacterium]|nr:SpoIIE family protein phosphatase [Candidatus Acidoferrales bacterium]